MYFLFKLYTSVFTPPLLVPSEKSHFNNDIVVISKTELSFRDMYRNINRSSDILGI